MTAYLTTEDVAGVLHCSVRTVQALVSRRAIPHTRPRGMRRCLFDAAQLDAWLAGAELETVELDGGAGRVVRPVAA